MTDHRDQRACPLHLVVGGAPPAARSHELVMLAHEQGWEVDVTLMAEAAEWVDAGQLARLSGRPVSSGRAPAGGAVGRAGVVVVAPATFTLVNKLRHGIADSVVLAWLCRSLGAGVPLVVVPAVEPDLAAHGAYQESLRELRRWGVRVADEGPDPGWEAVLRLAAAAAGLGGDVQLEALVAAYREAAAGHGRAMQQVKPGRANRHADAVAAAAAELRRRGPEAQRWLLPLLQDDDPGVAIWAATHALEFAPDQAQRVLERLAVLPGHLGLTAVMTLAEWREGRLTFP